MSPDPDTTGAIGWLDLLDALPVADRLSRVEFSEGSVLFREADTGQFFLIVLAGEADVHRHGRMIATVGPGSVLGELALLTGEPRSTTVTARTAMACFRGTADEFAELLDSDPIREHFTHLAASRLAENVDPVAFEGRNGFQGELRPLLPTDRPAYVELLGKLSPESRRRRFFSAGIPGTKLIDYLLHIDFVDHFAWVVLDCSTSPHTGVGIARFIRNDVDPHRAEAAFAVIDDFQGKGLGTIMLGALAVAAEAAGITTFTAEVLDENTPMRRVFSKVDATWKRADRGVLAAVMSVARVKTVLSTDLQTALENATHGIGMAAATALKL